MSGRDIYDLLGIPEDAGRREIRAAYSRELKKIDQQADPEGFQQLRIAYELALYGLEPLPEPQPEPLERGTSDDNGLGAFKRFRATTASLAAEDHHAWSDTLVAHLESEELINLMSRSQFEILIAHHLAAGWQMGNELLFAAACQTFHWASDQRRVAQFGQAGRLLNQAIREQQMLETLAQQQAAPLRAAISRMRDQRAPTTEELRHYNLPINRLTHRYAALMSVILDRETFKRWQMALENAPALWQAHAAPPQPTWLQNLIYGLTVIAVIYYVLCQY